MSKLLLIGEAWGADEERASKKAGHPVPFVGQAGKVLDRIISRLGHTRQEVDIWNVMDERPKRNDFWVYYQDLLRTEPTEKLLTAWQDLQTKLAETKPNCVLALGKEAWRALVGLDYESRKYRGSVLERFGTKVMTTYHPSLANRKGKLEDGTPVELLIMIDFARALKESQYSGLRLKPRLRRIAPKYMDAIGWLHNYKGKLAVDIETLEQDGGIIDCIGFAKNSYDSMVIPFLSDRGDYWMGGKELIWGAIKRVLEDPEVQVIGQNFYYDNYWLLRKHGIKVANLWFDNLSAMKILYPDFPASLAFQNSIFCDIGYYKDDRKVQKGKKIDFPKRWNYCANDVLCTYESYEKLEEGLKRSDKKMDLENNK